MQNPLRLPRKTASQPSKMVRACGFQHFDLEMCFAPQRRALFSTSQLPKVVRAWWVLCILTSKSASRHNGVHFFDISTSKSGPSLVCFVHFDFEMCFAPQRRALFRHLSFQKCSFRAWCVFSPHLCVGFLFLILYPAPPPPPPAPPPHTHNFVTNTTLSHITLSHITLSHITLSHTHNFVTLSFTHSFVTDYLSHTHNFHTHNFVTHHLSHISHTTLSQTPLSHTQLCHTHTISLTHSFATHHLSHTTSFTHSFVTPHLSQTTLSHTIFHTHLWHWARGRRGTWRHPPSFHVAGVALGDIHLRFAWQAWHCQTSALSLRGRRRSPVTPRHFAWQAW